VPILDILRIHLNGGPKLERWGQKLSLAVDLQSLVIQQTDSKVVSLKECLVCVRQIDLVGEKRPGVARGIVMCRVFIIILASWVRCAGGILPLARPWYLGMGCCGCVVVGGFGGVGWWCIFGGNALLSEGM